MANFYDNTAYDFEKFAPKREAAEIVNLPEQKSSPRKHRSTDHAAALKKKLSAALGVAVILMLVFMQIHCQIQNTEVTEKIYQTKEKINVLKSEETRLSVELEGKVSFNNMEKMAGERGMQKATTIQTKYISLCDEDSVEISENNKNVFEKIASLF